MFEFWSSVVSMFPFLKRNSDMGEFLMLVVSMARLSCDIGTLVEKEKGCFDLNRCGRDVVYFVEFVSIYTFQYNSMI